MGLFGFGKKKEAKQGSTPISQPDIRHIDDLDIPQLPTDTELDAGNVPLPTEGAADTSKVEGKPIPEELPPIEDVPSYDDEFLPLPEKSEEQKEYPKEITKQEPEPEIRPSQIPTTPNPYQQINLSQKEIPYASPKEQRPAQIFTSSQPLEGPRFEIPKQASELKIPSGVYKNYMRLSNYKSLLADITNLNVGLKQASKTMTRIRDVKNPEDSEFNRWKEVLEDIERKVLYIDKTIFG